MRTLILFVACLTLTFASGCGKPDPSLLRHAAASGDIELVKSLVSKGADVNAKATQRDLTPLDWTKCSGGNEAGREAVAKYLTDLGEQSGRQITVCCPDTRLLHKTIMESDVEHVKAHVAQGEDVMPKTIRAERPLTSQRKRGTQQSLSTSPVSPPILAKSDCP